MNNLKKSDTWKIQLAIAINFISSIDNGEEHVMYSISDTKKPRLINHFLHPSKIGTKIIRNR